MDGRITRRGTTVLLALVLAAAALWGVWWLVGTPLETTKVASAQDTLNCENFISQAEAQANLRQDPSDPNNLDDDDDGIACDTETYADPARDETPVFASGGDTSQTTPQPAATGVVQYADDTGTLMEAGGPSAGPVPPMPGGTR